MSGSTSVWARAGWRRVQASSARDVAGAARTLGWELRTLAVHARSARRAAADPTLPARARRISLGSGRAARPGWLCIDLEPAADLRVDLRRPLPLPDGCAELVHGEHVLEHLDWPGDAELLLRECFRVLRPGGMLHVGVPDARAPLEEYVAGGGPLLTHAREQGWHGPAETLLDQVNALFRQGGQHRYAYDDETLTRRLRAAGFADVEVRDFDPAVDTPTRRIGTLYVRGRRPAA